MPSLLAASLFFCVGSARQGGEAPPALPPALPIGALEQSETEGVPAQDWTLLLARDARVSFAPRTAKSALRELERPGLAPERRAAALLALGAGRAFSERSRLESWAREGSPLERQGALFGLGELGPPDDSTLRQVAAAEDPELAECALLALLRCARPAARRLVEQTAAGGGPLATAAGELLAFALDPGSSRESRAARAFLELRYAAAVRHGLVDGQNWSVLVLERLCGDEAFLDDVVYRAACELRTPGVRDHFLEAVLEGAGPGALRGAVFALPGELGEIAGAGLWQPADAAAWAALLAEIDERRLEGLSDALLERALAVPDARLSAAVLLLRGGNPRALALIELELPAAPPEARARIAEVLAGARDPLAGELLSRLLEDPEPAVRAAALVARVRQGHRLSKSRVERTLEETEDDSGDAAERAALVREMCRSARDPEILSMLARLVSTGRGEERLEAATALAAAGRGQGRELVREALHADPAGPRALERARALARAPSPPDLELFRELFPVEGAPEVDALLARALIRARDAAAMPVLRAALWRTPWNRSVLAGALIAEVQGLNGLREELQHPPRGATSRDLRRVGFALGEWGGLEQVEALSARAGSGDPAVQGALLGALGARTH